MRPIVETCRHLFILCHVFIIYTYNVWLTVHLVFEEIYSWKEEQLLFIVRSLACKVKAFFFPCKPFKSIPYYSLTHLSPYISLLLDPFPLLTNLHVCFRHVYLLDFLLPDLYIHGPSGFVYKESWLTKRHYNSDSNTRYRGCASLRKLLIQFSC